MLEKLGLQDTNVSFEVSSTLIEKLIKRVNA
jgi:hypothetical protein